MTGDFELELLSGNQRAVVSTLGASLRSYQVAGEDALWGYSGAENKKGGQGDVLIPFPSRIKGGHYRFLGESHQLERNDKEGPNAIHGFLRTVEWSHERQGDSTIIFRHEMTAEEYGSRGYPFSLKVELTYRLGVLGLSCEFLIRNIGVGPAPVGAGFHPYFVVGGPIDEAELSLPASDYLEFESLVPTGRVLSVAGTELDYRELRRIGNSQFNQCFANLDRGPDGIARAVLRDPSKRKTITVWMDQAFQYLVAYSGDAIPAPDTRKAFAIEPLTCATDAFNHPEWGLKVLAVGEEFRGKFGVGVRMAQE